MPKNPGASRLAIQILGQCPISCGNTGLIYDHPRKVIMNQFCFTVLKFVNWSTWYNNLKITNFRTVKTKLISLLLFPDGQKWNQCFRNCPKIWIASLALRLIREGTLYGQGFLPASRGPSRVRFLRRSPGDTTLSEPGDSVVVSSRLAHVTTIGLQLQIQIFGQLRKHWFHFWPSGKSNNEISFVFTVPKFVIFRLLYYVDQFTNFSLPQLVPVSLL